GATTLYHVLAGLAPPARHVVQPPPGGYPVGQFQIADYGVRVQPDPESAVMVAIPPTWNVVITALLTRAPGRRAPLRLEAALSAVEAAYPYTPSGVFTLIAYGLPYFHRYIHPAVFAPHLPHMTSAVDPAEAPVLLDAIRFPSDPPSTLLEANEVVFH